MPSDANGVYSLPSGYLAVTGETIQASQHNPPLEDIASSMTQRLMRSGAAPMTGPLKLTDGTTAAPGLAFNTSTSTGLYKTSAGFAAAVNGTKVAEFGEGGLISGAHPIGALIAYTGLTAPDLWLLPYGQTLNRADYPALWAFAADEIAAGNTLFTNGNGSTTFTILDMRGRVPACKDNIGGTAASRLTSAQISPDGVTLGATGGSQSVTLTEAQMPSHSHTGGTGAESANHQHTFSGPSSFVSVGTDGPALGEVWRGNTVATSNSQTAGHTHSLSINSAGGGGAHSNLQPTIVCSYLLFAGA